MTAMVTILSWLPLFLFLTERTENPRKLPIPRVFRDRTNPLDNLSDFDAIARYRLPRNDIVELLELVKNDLRRPTSRSYAIPEITQVKLI